MWHELFFGTSLTYGQEQVCFLAKLVIGEDVDGGLGNSFDALLDMSFGEFDTSDVGCITEAQFLEAVKVCELLSFLRAFSTHMLTAFCDSILSGVD